MWQRRVQATDAIQIGCEQLEVSSIRSQACQCGASFRILELVGGNIDGLVLLKAGDSIPLEVEGVLLVVHVVEIGYRTAALGIEAPKSVVLCHIKGMHRHRSKLV